MRSKSIYLLGLLITVASSAKPEPRLLPAAAERSVDFTEDIKPILERSCVNCHANGKRKGGFSIDHLHSFVAGGDSGPAVIQGKSAESLLIKLVLSTDPEEVMPSKGKRLTLDEVALLRAWIDQGIKWEKGFTFAKFRNAPVAPRQVELPKGGEANPVDRLLAPYYSKNKIAPSIAVTDHIFVRRVFLDTIGLLPSPEEVTAFRDDNRPDKHIRLVEELLQDKKNYAEHWITFWSDCFRNSYTRQYHGGGGKRITDWLKKSLEENKPYDQFVRELISPVGGSDGFIKGVAWRGTVNASQVVEMQAAQNVAQVFLGLNIKCASCHDSFINDWTLKQTYSFASIFSEGPMDVHRCNKPTGEKAEPAFLYPELGSIDAKAPRKERVKQLSEIITSPKNGRLARTVVNRLWAIFFGRGLVDPVDEMDNPTWNQDLLDWLANDFADHGYDLKRTMKILLTSRAYQRPSVRLNEDVEEYVFHGPVVRRLSAEQFLDGIDQVIVAAGKDVPRRHTGGQRAGMRNLDRLMRTLGRPKRDVVVTRRESTATTAQLIELSNGKPFADLMIKGGNAWEGSGYGADVIVRKLFANALGREPSENEANSAQSVLGKTVNAQAVADLLWMLAMHPEFQLIH